MVAFSKMSESNSTPSLRSGLVKSSETLRLLFPASLLRLPPTASSVSAICSAVRVLVPLTKTLAMRGVMPFVSGVSAKSPPRKTDAIETRGRRGSSRTSSRRPFANSNFWISPAEIGFASSALAASDPLGLSEMTVRLSSIRYLPATRRPGGKSKRLTSPGRYMDLFLGKRWGASIDYAG